MPSWIKHEKNTTSRPGLGTLDEVATISGILTYLTLLCFTAREVP